MSAISEVIMSEKKHNYPKIRKPRDVSYSKSYKLLQAIGENQLRKFFEKAGMYTVSKQVSDTLDYYVSPYVVRHCRDRYKLGVKKENANI